MSVATTAAQVGAEYAEQIHADRLASGPVNVEEMLGSTQDIPDGDCCCMRDNGIEPNAREYWHGYNARMAELNA
jgi:hypothetical protein